MRLRVRGPEGVATITIDNGATYGDLLHQIREKTGVPDFDLKYGYPPQPFNATSIDGATKLSDLDVKLDGEQLIVMPRDLQAQLSHPLSGGQSKPSAIEPPQLQEPDRPLSLTRKSQTDLSHDPPEIPVPSLEGLLVLRVMPDDNSCLFRALSSALLGETRDDTTPSLRRVVAETILSQPDTYSSAVLDNKDPAAYCRWIQRASSWGGGIELAILSQHFDVEVCSINVQDLRIDRFNEGRPTRCVLVYSGIHYDVCALSPFSGAPPEVDRRIFDVVRHPNTRTGSVEEEGGMEEDDRGVLQAARELCQVLRNRHYFTDTKGFGVRCQICGEGGKGEKWALAHASETGHADFGEG